MTNNTKEKSTFKPVLYAVCSAVIVGVVLTLLTVFAFTTRYTAFSAEKVAKAYTDCIVQTGDGYNAYKNTLVSKNQKYGNFIINAYMLPYVNEEAEKNAEIGTGSVAEAEMLDKVYNDMYDYYISLITQYGYDNYDAIFSNYFAKLKEVRTEIIGDDYMDTDFMFSVFESNVDTFGKSLTGTELEYEADGKTVKQEATIGAYQEIFGENYKLITNVVKTTSLSDDEVKAYADGYAERISAISKSGEAKADQFGIKDVDSKHTYKSDMISAFEKLDVSGDINAVKQCELEIITDDATVVATQNVYVVQIGNSWYVDNSNIDTSALYITINK